MKPKGISILWVDDRMGGVDDITDVYDRKEYTKELKNLFGADTKVTFITAYQDLSKYDGEEGFELIVCDNNMKLNNGSPVDDAAFKFGNVVKNIHRRNNTIKPLFFLLTADKIVDSLKGVSTDNIDRYLEKGTDMFRDIFNSYTTCKQASPRKRS